MRFRGKPPRAAARAGLAAVAAALLTLALVPAARAASAASGASAATSTAPVRAAVFDFDLIDTSLSGEMRGAAAAETARLKRISALLRELLAASGKYEIVDATPLAAQIARVNLQGCNGCDGRFAQELGAEIAVTGTVQKVSELILNINIYVRDAGSRKLLRAMSADMRGNTDKSWEKALRWLVEHRFLAE